MANDRRRRAWWCACAAAIAILTAGLAAAPAGVSLAGDGAAEVEVTAGVNGRVEANDQLLVRVTVDASELIDGELVVTGTVGATTVRQPIHVPAGTTKQFHLLMPSGFEGSQVTASVRDGGDTVATVEARATVADGELVGVLPRLAARIGELPDDPVDLGEDLGTASIAAVPPEIVDLGIPALRAYDTLVAGDDDLAALDDTARRALWTWLSTGGVLLLDDEAASAELPDEWAIGPAGYAWAGLGEVHLTDGEAAAGNWAEIVPLTYFGSPGMFMGTEMMWGEGGPSGELISRAGLDLPTIAPLAIGLGVYGLVLGPIVYFVLRRLRRLTLGWLLIPALAVVTAGGVALAGGGALRRGEPAAAAFVQDGPDGAAYALSSVLTFSSNGGRAELDVPAGWALQQPNGFFGEAPLPITVSRLADGTSTSSVALEATQADVRNYVGITGAIGLTTTAALDGAGDVHGTVTNDTELTFTDVAVFTATGQRKIGMLAPGESKQWSLRAPTDLLIDWNPRGAAVWGNPWGPDGQPVAADGTGAEWGIWGNASMDLDLFPTGMVRVVGWTDGAASDLLGGDDSTVTAVSSVVPVTSEDGRVGAATVRAATVRGPFGMVAGNLGNDQVIRYVLPPEAAHDERPLFLAGVDDIGAEEVSFWDGEQWIAVADAADEPAIPIPPEAVRDGAILVLTGVDMNRGPIGVPVVTDEEPA